MNSPSSLSPEASFEACQFCRCQRIEHWRVSTIFGTASLCDDCLGNYREQLAHAVAMVNTKKQTA